MKKQQVNTRKLMQFFAILSLLVAGCACYFIERFNLTLVANDKTKNNLCIEIIERIILSFALFFTTILFYPKNLKVKIEHLSSNIAWATPCILVAIANIPFVALISGTATVGRRSLFWMFLTNCILIGIVEELVFRVIINSFVKEKFSNKKDGYIFHVIISSLIFALFHLLNLFSGASVSATLLQVGYSFLLGALLTVTYDRTKNIWLCIVIHAIFDFGGNLVPTLGWGTFQDTAYWIIMSVVGVMCALHIIFYIFGHNRRMNKVMRRRQSHQI